MLRQPSWLRRYDGRCRAGPSDERLDTAAPLLDVPQCARVIGLSTCDFSARRRRQDGKNRRSCRPSTSSQGRHGGGLPPRHVTGSCSSFAGTALQDEVRSLHCLVGFRDVPPGKDFTRRPGNGYTSATMRLPAIIRRERGIGPRAVALSATPRKQGRGARMTGACPLVRPHGSGTFASSAIEQLN